MRTVLFCAVFFLCARCAGAELIETKSGRVFEGEVVQETEDMMTIREPAGDGYVENNYEKAELVRVGDRPVGGESAGGQEKAAAPDSDSRERVDYERALRGITDEIASVKRVWDADHADLGPIKEWLDKFAGLKSGFTGTYGASAPVSFSYMNTVFGEVEHFASAVSGMEKADASYHNSLARNSEGWQRRFKECYDEDERLAGEALRNAVKYAGMARDKAARH